MDDPSDNYGERILNISLILSVLLCLFVFGQNFWDNQYQKLSKVTEDARAIAKPGAPKTDVPKAAKQISEELQTILSAEGRRGNSYWVVTCLCSVLVFLAYGQANERLEEVETHGFLVVCMIWALAGPPILQVLNLRAEQLRLVNSVTVSLQQEVKSGSDAGDILKRVNSDLAVLENATVGERFQSWRVAAMAVISTGLIIGMWGLVRRHRGHEDA
jgi:hypothetical protein